MAAGGAGTSRQSLRALGGVGWGGVGLATGAESPAGLEGLGNVPGSEREGMAGHSVRFVELLFSCLWCGFRGVLQVVQLATGPVPSPVVSSPSGEHVTHHANRGGGDGLKKCPEALLIATGPRCCSPSLFVLQQRSPTHLSGHSAAGRTHHPGGLGQADGAHPCRPK